MDAQSPLAELLKINPRAIVVFEKYRIDFCCGGRRSLELACREQGVSLADVLADLAEIDRESADIPTLPTELPELIRYVEATHHVYTRETLARLLPLAAKVARVHGERHPELAHVWDLIEALADDLEPHMLKEERILFPYAIELAQASSSKTAARRPPFGTVQNPIAMMREEHRRVGELLAALEEATKDSATGLPFSLPNDGCGSYSALFSGLADLVRDVRRHVYIENELIFPMAVALESQRD